MSKAVMISIRPKWCEKIASGEKTIEVRKTRPKLETPFKCYIYCTMDHPYISVSCGELDKLNYRTNTVGRCNGKVIGEFVCDCVTPLYNVCTDDWKRLTGGLHRIEKELVNQACLTEAQLHTYAIGKNCFAWHISNLKIYDTPKELIEFHTWKKCKSCSKSGYESTACIYDENCMIPAAITKAPLKEPRPPRAPYCLCGSLRKWILQQVSPSCYFMYRFSGENRRANAYFAKLKDYHTKLIQYRVELRICSRLEWDILYRGLRMKRKGG